MDIVRHLKGKKSSKGLEKTMLFTTHKHFHLTSRSKKQIDVNKENTKISRMGWLASIELTVTAGCGT